jgi:amidase
MSRDPRGSVAPPGELLLRSATDAAALVRSGTISSRELTGHLLDRIASANPAVNAVVEMRREAALSDADGADRAIASGDTRPLLGVPMTVKDAFNVAGLHTTWGNPAFKEYVADADATVVARLKAAGAVIVGKSNVAMMLSDFAQTSNPLFGATNNPWDVSRTPGGSSGGAAAALAAGMAFLEYGSDLAGSIRIPASFCGVYGIKPSVGLVPLTGFQPPGPPAIASDMTWLSSLGPLARSAADLRAALLATAGPEAPLSNAYGWRLHPPRRATLGAFRVGIVLDDERGRVSSEIAGRLSNLADALAGAGASIAEGWPAGVDPAKQHESFGYFVQLFFAFQQPRPGAQKLSEFIEHEIRRMAAREAWRRYFTNIDVFVCPTNFTAAFPHDQRPFDQRTITTPEGERPYTDQTFWISHASLVGLPAASAPIGTTRDGLPVGAQIIGPLFEDDTAISFAQWLADVV